MKTITVTIKFTVQPATPDPENRRVKALELLQPDSLREAFVDTEQEALDHVSEIFANLYLGDFKVAISEEQ